MLPDLITPKKSLFVPGAHTELRCQQNRTRQASFVSGNPVGNSRNEFSGISARVCKRGVYGFSSIAELSESAAETVLKAASDNADFLARHAGKSTAPFPATESKPYFSE